MSERPVGSTGAISGSRADLRASSTRQQLSTTLELSALAAVVVIANVLWVRTHRRGLPFDIDEAGYLQRAIRDDDAFRHGGLAGLWHAFRLPDPQAPLLPFTGAFWRQLTNAGPVGLIAAEQLFVVVVVASTFFLARQLNRSLVAALVAAACAGTLPGVIDGGQGFGFFLPAAALMTATLASQLAARDFQRLAPSLAWGFVFGVATLSRTVMVALLPAAALAAVLRLVAARARPRQWANLLAGLLLALAVASTWYSATWRLVWDYLTGFGYGSQATTYGRPRPPLDWHTWTFRLVQAMNTEVYLPLSVSAVVCAVVALTLLVRRRPAFEQGMSRTARRFIGGGWGTVTVVLLADYVILSSTRNVGSYFELPLLPSCAALLVCAASLAGPIGRGLALTTASAAAAFSLAATDGLLPGRPARPIVALGPLRVVAYDSRGPLVSYSTRFLTTGVGGTEALLRRWQRSNVELSNLIFSESGRHGHFTPVVFFAVQDPFVNTNSLALLAQERGVSLPIGLLVPPALAGESYAAQLEDPARGIPDVLIVGPRSANQAASQFSAPVARSAVRKAAAAEGFRPVAGLTLPDGRRLTIWWRIRRRASAS